MNAGGGGRVVAAIAIAIGLGSCFVGPTLAEDGSRAQLAAHLDALCVEIGARPSGSPALAAALDYAEAQFHAAGLPRIWRQSFDASVWSGEASLAWTQGSRRIQIPAVAMARAASTPAAGVEGRLIELGHGSAAEFGERGAELLGAIVLVRDDGTQEGHPPHPIEVAANAGVAKAAAVILAPEPGAPVFTGSVARNGSLELPVICVDGDTGVTLRDRARELPSSALMLHARGSLSRHPTTNVIAELPGEGDADSVVLVVAHVDSWELGVGARDNAAGVAMLLEMARRLHEVGPHHRSIRFAALSGEELGLEGSRHYLQRERESIAQHVAVLNLEQPGAPAGFVVHGGAGLRAPLTAVYATHRARGLFGGVLLRPSFYSDHLPFLLAGIPTFALRTRTGEEPAREHSVEDRREAIDVDGLNDAVELATAAIRRLAAREARAIAHLNDEELNELLAPWGLDLQRLRQENE